LASKHTASELFAAALALSLLMPFAISAEPLPPELENSYKNFRKVAENEMGSFLNMRSYSLENITLIMREITYHDAGMLDANNSEIGRRYGVDISGSTRMAEEYLKRNVIEPLKRNRSITLETGDVIDFRDLSEPELLELLFYYVRDHIRMAGPQDVPEGDRWEANLPGLGRFVVSRDKIVQFPTETVSLGRGGICYDKALLLGTLLEIEGYKVAYGYYVSMAVNLGPVRLPLPGYHSYVLVKDEGWGIGNWTVGGAKDMNGKAADGKWIVLDPLYSPSYAPNMQMVGEHRAVGFAETPPWAEGLIREQKGSIIPSELVFIL